MFRYVLFSILTAVFYVSFAAAVVFLLARYVSTIRQQGRMRFGQDEAYRDMAAKGLVAQTEAAAALGSLSTAVAEIQSRLATIKHILKQVE